MKHFNITFMPDNRCVSIHTGATLIQAAGLAGIILNTICGGKGTCKKCTVRLEPDGQEVLACQYLIDSDLTVTIPPNSRFYQHKILEHGIDIRQKLISKIKQKSAPGYGLAIDIGTTTVVAKLIGLANGQTIATVSALNPQTKYGDDVISRISYAENNEKLLNLNSLITDCLNDLITLLCKQASIKTKQILDSCIVGNTTMNHIFLKLPITQLGQAPYKASSLDPKNLSAKEAGLNLASNCNVYTPPNIAGFVGADTTAVALATDIISTQEKTLVIDIGTNGEIVFGDNNKLYAASCAAGPALEGARITCGSRAADGAIETVVANDNDIDIDVIGTGPALSICGSGLIDAVAVMLDLGIIDTTGRFVEKTELTKTLPPAIYKRLTEHENQPAFILAKDVYLTQLDIRQLQLAKAAIKTGILLLQKKLGLENGDIKHILLAGAFGNYIRRESAIRINMLPAVPVERIQFIGNAASSGAQMILLSDDWKQKCVELAAKIEYIELANEPDFTTFYTDSIMF